MYSLLASGYGTSSSPSLQVLTLNNEETIHSHTTLHLDNPSFACVHGTLLFTLSETADIAKVQMFRITATELVYLDERSLSGGGLCHISYSPKHQTLFGACYQTGHIFSVGVGESGFTQTYSHIQLTAHSQDSISRAHCVQMDPSETFLYAVNIHTDLIYCYRIENGVLTPNTSFPTLQLTIGLGPRHITFHPTLDIAYIITEYSNDILTLAHNPTTGELTLLQTLSTLPTDFEGESYCSTCVIPSNAQYLLAANRGHNSITRFKILGDGTLKLLDFAPCGGDWPRHIACSRNGELLLVCNERSDHITLIELNRTTSKLGKTIDSIPFNKPSYITEY
ncbi:MAG: lactonase family protein [Cellulosilyticaceae bacterium]